MEFLNFRLKNLFLFWCISLTVSLTRGNSNSECWTKEEKKGCQSTLDPVNKGTVEECKEMCIAHNKCEFNFGYYPNKKVCNFCTTKTMIYHPTSTLYVFHCMHLISTDKTATSDSFATTLIPTSTNTISGGNSNSKCWTKEEEKGCKLTLGLVNKVTVEECMEMCIAHNKCEFNFGYYPNKKACNFCETETMIYHPTSTLYVFHCMHTSSTAITATSNSFATTNTTKRLITSTNSPETTSTNSPETTSSASFKESTSSIWPWIILSVAFGICINK